MKPKLTLNFGLRYDLESPTTERHNKQVYGFNPNATLPVQVPGLTLKRGLLLSGITATRERAAIGTSTTSVPVSVSPIMP